MFFWIYFILFSLIGILASNDRAYGKRDKLGSDYEAKIVIGGLIFMALILLLNGEVFEFFFSLPLLWLSFLAYNIMLKSYSFTDLVEPLKEDWFGNLMLIKIAKNQKPTKYDLFALVLLYESIVVIGLAMSSGS